jgi:hypothetical protein
MNRQSTRSFTIALVPSFAAFLLVQACGGGSDAIAQQSSDPLEGVWESQVTTRDCTSGAVLRTFKGLAAFHRGGTMTAVNNQPPSSNGPAVGRWSAGSSGGYTAQFRFFRFNADGTPAGSQRVTHQLTLDATGTSATGTLNVQLLDGQDNVVGSFCGATANQRVG